MQTKKRPDCGDTQVPAHDMTDDLQTIAGQLLQVIGNPAAYSIQNSDGEIQPDAVDRLAMMSIISTIASGYATTMKKRMTDVLTLGEPIVTERHASLTVSERTPRTLLAVSEMRAEYDLHHGKVYDFLTDNGFVHTAEERLAAGLESTVNIHLDSYSVMPKQTGGDDRA